ncbi:hypothetical protein SAMN04489712_103290 [Thermomonospora echinospora]|uniref:EcsC protein family protein n=1 Tax=Thermomonospora echinospora TaxID=1992 RepID=A0A1H5XJW4_9ACTN|nr:hypothetical protein [Thermomonospora echinospora]SEG12074.1 hypothetical protein SAMN04489712_103290 [Thermomonospora echinospora]
MSGDGDGPPDRAQDDTGDLGVPAPRDGGRNAEIAELVGRLAGDDLDPDSRRRLLGRLTRLLAEGARRTGATGLRGGRWLADLLMEITPHLPVRDAPTLSAHHHGLTGERLADSLVRVAANGTTAVGAAGGALAAVQFTAPPLLLTAPAQIAAETLVISAIEVKLIAELHAVYGVDIPGSGTARAGAFLTSWARRRGINPLETGSLTNALGTAAKTALRKRLLRTFGRSMSTMGPFLTGAAAGATLNRTATKRLAEAVREDLRRHMGPAPAVPHVLPRPPLPPG